MMFRALALAALLSAPGALYGVSSASAEEACPVSRMPPILAPATKAKIAARSEVLIVALGSSSTQGVQASSPGNSYPARLQADLSVALPRSHVAVINRGIGGEDAVEELARLEKDVVVIRPDMVIWQVGANAAMAGGDPELFRKLVSTGIERLQSLGVDVVLMDNQRSPMILASPQHAVLEQVMADLSRKYRVSLFSRGSLMDGWKNSGMTYEHFLSHDFVHMNDLGYHCTADALAAAIEAGLGLADRAVLSGKPAGSGIVAMRASN